jgi:hypothetical protein
VRVDEQPQSLAPKDPNALTNVFVNCHNRHSCGQPGQAPDAMLQDFSFSTAYVGSYAPLMYTYPHQVQQCDSDSISMDTASPFSEVSEDDKSASESESRAARTSTAPVSSSSSSSHSHLVTGLPQFDARCLMPYMDGPEPFLTPSESNRNNITEMPTYNYNYCFGGQYPQCLNSTPAF